MSHVTNPSCELKGRKICIYEEMITNLYFWIKFIVHFSLHSELWTIPPLYCIFMYILYRTTGFTYIKDHTGVLASFISLSTNHVCFKFLLTIFQCMFVFFQWGSHWFPFISLRYENQLTNSRCFKSICH